MKINVGCGGWPLTGWVNLDRSESTRASLRADALALPFGTETVDEVYAGHFLEHLTLDEADRFLGECRRVLRPGGGLGIVVPDTRTIMGRYMHGPALQVEFLPTATSSGRWVSTDDLDDICAGFLYSTLQPSQHKWSYDSATLRRRLEVNGFRCEREINRWFDPRIFVGAWYQCGWQAVKES